MPRIARLWSSCISDCRQGDVLHFARPSQTDFRVGRMMNGVVLGLEHVKRLFSRQSRIDGLCQDLNAIAGRDDGPKLSADVNLVIVIPPLDERQVAISGEVIA